MGIIEINCNHCKKPLGKPIITEDGYYANWECEHCGQKTITFTAEGYIEVALKEEQRRIMEDAVDLLDTDQGVNEDE
jgi:uncharacterized Zn finger protein